MEPTEATPLEPTSAKSWKQAARTPQTTEPQPCVVTSGNVALVRKVSLDQFLTSGWIPNPLIPMLEDVMKRGMKKGTPELDSIEKIVAMKKLVNRVVVECTAEPVVLPSPPCTSCSRSEDDGVHAGIDFTADDEKVEAHEYVSPDRDEDALYIDDVDWDDRFDVYAFALSEVSAKGTFRPEQGSDVERVPDSKAVRDKTKRTAKRK